METANDNLIRRYSVHEVTWYPKQNAILFFLSKTDSTQYLRLGYMFYFHSVNMHGLRKLIRIAGLL